LKEKKENELRKKIASKLQKKTSHTHDSTQCATEENSIIQLYAHDECSSDMKGGDN
jgi:hypothetical protein